MTLDHIDYGPLAGGRPRQIVFVMHGRYNNKFGMQHEMEQLARAMPHALFVRPEARGAGLADDLVAAVAGWARRRGFAGLELGVVEGNAAAERVYSRCGFVREGDPLDRSDRELAPEVRMTLAL